MIYWCAACLISFVVVVTTFEIQCPHSSHWKKRSTLECVLVSSYLCLFNPLKSSYDEKCGSEDIARKGSMYILTPNLHQTECLPDSYQPFTFTTNGNSECIFAKSNCNDDGQVKASEGSTVLDRTCKCDYTRGYSYITRPRNICSCVPSEEDCTCYFSPCNDNTVMVPDYTCKAKNQLLSSSCPVISPLPDSNNSKESKPDLFENGISKPSMSAEIFKYLITAFAVLSLACIVINLVLIKGCEDDSNAAFDGHQLDIKDLSYDEMFKHREDGLYVKTSSINEAKESLQRKGIVLITGREGTGKSKLCLELASLFHQEDGYLPFKAKNEMSYYNASNLFCIFDQINIETSRLTQLVENNNKVVITCRTSELSSMLEKLRTNEIDVHVINLDTALTKTEMEHILSTYTKHFNILKTSGTEKEIQMYSVLVFIYVKNELNVAELDKNKSSFLALQGQLFPRVNCVNPDFTESVTAAANCMLNKYLKYNNGVYTFSHNCMSQALFLSCKDFEAVIIKLLKSGPLEDIILFVRSQHDESTGDDLEIILEDKHKDRLCERLCSEFGAMDKELENIGSYIYEKWIRDISFKEKFLSCVTTSRQSSQGTITPFWRVVLAIDHITANGKDPWIYQSDVSDFILLCGIIAASAFHYSSSDLKKETFHCMLNKFNNKIQNKQFLDILCSELDQFGNTFFHYLVIGNENESRHIFLTKNAALLKAKNRPIFGKQNKMKYTPLHSAAYLGKCTILKLLLVKTKGINKGKQHLLNVATMGVEAVFNCTKIGQKYNDDSGKALVDRKRGTSHADENPKIIYERDKRFEHDSTPIQCETELTRQENVKVSEMKDDGEKTKFDACFEGIPFLVTGNREDFDKILKLLNQKKLDRSVISKEVNCMP